MEKVSLRAEFVERTKKDGEKFEVVELYISKDVKKLVFLAPAEKELIKIQLNNNTQK